MTKSHGRKSRARNKSRNRGAAYAAANAGTLHQHDSGPTNQDLQPTDPSRWGVETAPDMRTASALIGACVEQCAPCQQSLAAKLLDEDPIVLAVTAGSVYSLQGADQRDAGSLASDAAQLFVWALQASPGEGHLMLRCVELLNPEDRAALLEDALGLWTFYSHKPAGLVRGQEPGPKITVPGGEQCDRHDARRSGSPAVRARTLPLHRPPVTPVHARRTWISMSENTENIEQQAEDAARSLVELVSVLEDGGLQYPLEAYRIYSYLTRAAAEMGNALDLIGASVQGLHEKGRLMSDYRGEPLDEVLARFTQSSGKARNLAGELHANLSKAHAAVGYIAFNDAPEVPKEQEPTARR